ncbi:MAG: hypothetical protein HRT89_12630, partial [Lentisphaeria bacterium]|nr:hypothetical protein [Lentisphaeria bacterium]
MNTKNYLWEDENATAQFLHVLIKIQAKHYKDAHKELMGLYKDITDLEKKEWILYYDMDLAREMKLDSAVISYRALRYLNEFPKGKHLGDSLKLLLHAYYEMELYGKAMQTAKRMFINNVVGNKSRSKNNEWLLTVVKIGQCYAKIGDYEKANIIYRTYYNDIIHSDMPDDVYADWVNLAVHQNQNHEAVRRLDIIIPKIKDPFKKYSLIVARSVRRFLVNSTGSYAEAEEIVKMVENASGLSDKQKESLLRKLYESMLEYTINKDLDEN